MDQISGPVQLFATPVRVHGRQPDAEKQRVRPHDHHELQPPKPNAAEKDAGQPRAQTHAGHMGQVDIQRDKVSSAKQCHEDRLLGAHQRAFRLAASDRRARKLRKSLLGPRRQAQDLQGELREGLPGVRDRIL